MTGCRRGCGWREASYSLRVYAHSEYVVKRPHNTVLISTGMSQPDFDVDIARQRKEKAIAPSQERPGWKTSDHDIRASPITVLTKVDLWRI